MRGGSKSQPKQVRKRRHDSALGDSAPKTAVQHSAATRANMQSNGGAAENKISLGGNSQDAGATHVILNATIVVVNQQPAPKQSSAAKIASALYNGTAGIVQTVGSALYHTPGALVKGVKLTAEALKEDPTTVLGYAAGGAAAGAVVGAAVGLGVGAGGQENAYRNYIYKNIEKFPNCTHKYIPKVADIPSQLLVNCPDKNLQHKLITEASGASKANSPIGITVLKGAAMGALGGAAIGGAVGVHSVISTKRALQSTLSNARASEHRAGELYKTAMRQLTLKQYGAAVEALGIMKDIYHKLENAYITKNKIDDLQRIRERLGATYFGLGEAYEFLDNFTTARVCFGNSEKFRSASLGANHQLTRDAIKKREEMRNVAHLVRDVQGPVTPKRLVHSA